jgi:uncharacterized protein YqeY
MSTTRQRLYEEMKSCMKNGNKERLGVVRMLITEVKNAEINDPKVPGRERTEEEVMTLLGAYHKSLTKSLAEFPPERHPPLRAELAIVEEFLPKQLSESEIESVIADFLEKTADRQFGSLMKALQVELGGKASGQLISATLKRVLGTTTSQ